MDGDQFWKRPKASLRDLTIAITELNRVWVNTVQSNCYAFNEQEQHMIRQLEGLMHNLLYKVDDLTGQMQILVKYTNDRLESEVEQDKNQLHDRWTTKKQGQINSTIPKTNSTPSPGQSLPKIRASVEKDKPS